MKNYYSLKKNSNVNKSNYKNQLGFLFNKIFLMKYMVIKNTFKYSILYLNIKNNTDIYRKISLLKILLK